jgi:staphylococcal nuclease domain-containing protein 1
MTTWISGVVKGVTSGDAVIVVGTASAGVPPEKQLFLSGVSAPRLHEPFGLSSRDFLRRLAVGRPCAFRLEGSENGREQASVVVDGTDNLALLSLANGCCRLKGDPAAGQESPPVKAQAHAQTARLGVWGDAPASMPPPTAADPATLAPNVTLKAVVEAVLNGSMLRCTLGENRFVTASLAGVQCPSMNRRAAGEDAAGEQPQPEPFAREAKHHTEMLCLHRTVHLTPRGLDKFNNLLVTVSVEAGNGKPGIDVAEDILLQGLARVAEWSVAAARLNDAARLRSAESQAVQARRGVWHNHVPQANLGSFQARIVEVVSGDVVVVAHASTGAERRIGLASVRAPRMGNVKRGEPPTAAGLAAKEFLRASLIGRPLAVDLEYVRTTGGGGDEGGAGDEPQRTMEMASLYEEKRDARGAVLARRSVAELLVAQGLATVTRHKAGDPRAARYDALLAAEEQARAAKRGLHSGQEPALKPVQDLSRDAGRARAYHATLMRVGRLTAVVDFVISAGRLKLLVTKESVLILFSLAGVRSPRFATPGASEAASFLRNHVLQREVIITIESVNIKTGVFMGSLTYPTAPGAAPSVNLATALVQAGLASVHVTSDGRADSRDLREAEAAAREKKLGQWAHQAEEAPADDEADAADGKDFPVVVSDVHSGQLFFIQQQAQVADIEARLAAAAPAGGHSPAVSSLCLAQFSGDERWYRARVLRSDSATVRQVQFIDYGNVEEVPTSCLAALDPSLAALPAAAQPARLAFLAVPALDQDCGLAAAELLGSQTSGGRARFVARIEHRDRASGVVDVTLTPASDSQQKQSVNAMMLGEGLARISRRAMTTVRGRAVAAELQVHQDRARKLHLGLFVYGDLDSDEDEL